MSEEILFLSGSVAVSAAQSAAKKNSASAVKINAVENSEQRNSQAAAGLIKGALDNVDAEKIGVKRCRQAMRSFCFDCQGRLVSAVQNCADQSCPLHDYRLADSSTPRPLRAVRIQCLICCGGERNEVRQCKAGKTCALWPYRFGVSPAVYKKVKTRFRGPKHFTLPGMDV